MIVEKATQIELNKKRRVHKLIVTRKIHSGDCWLQLDSWLRTFNCNAAS